jgi:peptidoglycan/LPS O-acetylase OafA/YrhL
MDAVTNVQAAPTFHSIYLEAPAKRSERLPELDGLRGIAILQVVLWHYALLEPLHGSFVYYVLKLLRLSWSGVDLFFVLSGFLIGGILLDARESPNYFKTFYIRRFCRIFPLYYLVVAVLLAGQTFFASSPVFKGTFHWPVYAAYLQNFWSAATGSLGPAFLAVTWSLAVEEQFYLSLPMLIRITSAKILPWILTGIVVLTPLIRTYVFDHYGGGVACYVLPFCRTDSLCLGVLGALLVRSPVAMKAAEQSRRVINLLFCVVSAGVIWFLFEHPSPMTKVMSGAGYTLLAIFYWMVLLKGILQPDGVIARILRLRALQQLGILAYGVYLFHQPVMMICNGNTPPQFATLSAYSTVALAFVLTIVLAKISWHFFEKPIIHIGHRFRY